MTAEEEDALNMLLKTTEAAEAATTTKTWEGALKTASEANNRLQMVLEELKLMEYEAGATNRIIKSVVDMVAAMTE